MVVTVTFPTTEIELYRAVLTTIPTTEIDLYRVVSAIVPTTDIDLYRVALVNSLSFVLGSPVSLG